MSIADLRRELERIIAAADVGDTEDVKRRARNALEEIDADHLLTTTEAASMLGIRSVNTLKLLCKRGDVGYVMRGNRMMIPVSEIERVRDSDVIRGIRATDRLHDETAWFGADGGLSEEEMETLHQSRPGTLPWERIDTDQNQYVRLRDAGRPVGDAL